MTSSENPAAVNSTTRAHETAGLIEISGLTRRFGKVTAVHPVEVSIGPGGITGLLGPNGAGKSTLMRMLLGLTPRSGGDATVDGARLEGDGVAIRRRVSYAPGEIAVYGEMRAKDQLAWLLRGRDELASRRALDMADRMQLPMQQKIRGYSHGMKRLLLLIAALAPDVRVRILDEPTEGLDPTRRSEVLQLLRMDAETGRTILLSSHHLGEVDLVCDRRLFLRDGRLLDEQRCNELHERVRHALRIRWPEAPAAAVVEKALGGLGELRVEGQRATLFLSSEDPRPTITKVLKAQELPAPSSLSFGELSLGELYRELYGREGV